MRNVIARVSTHPMRRIAELSPRRWRELRSNPGTAPPTLAACPGASASSRRARRTTEERTHQGRLCHGKTPMRTFLDSVPLAKEKMLAA